MSPQLALALGQRFPTTAPLKEALRGLVRVNASDPALQQLPAAALLLAAAAAPGDNGRTATAEELQVGRCCLAVFQNSAAFNNSISAGYTHVYQLPELHVLRIQLNSHAGSKPTVSCVVATFKQRRLPASRFLLQALARWRPAHAIEGLELLSGPGSKHEAVRAYAIRCDRREQRCCGYWPTTSHQYILPLRSRCNLSFLCACMWLVP